MVPVLTLRTVFRIFMDSNVQQFLADGYLISRAHQHCHDVTRQRRQDQSLGLLPRLSPAGMGCGAR